MVEEEGLIFRRHKEWLEGLGVNFPSNKCAPSSLLVNDDKLVMGINGRRLHKIEALSDTIISFQKVIPTARDRIVQISGQNIYNINIAKNLIDTTIKQNASPIPFNEFGDNYESSNNYQSCDFYPNSNHFTKCNNVQSSSRNSLSDNEPVCHNIRVLVNEKETNIIVTDKNLGEKLESFLHKYNFSDFIMSSNKEEKAKSANRNIRTVPAPVVPEVPVSGRIVYERDFLLKCRYNNSPTPRVIEEIMKNQAHLYR
ncbi:hypothetical protein TYRP_010783 [Tyrophagus putrescentiae]|nr:hypothetical protein TYRP_010783 [Tyrophagus putrescentiae]